MIGVNARAVKKKAPVLLTTPIIPPLISLATPNGKSPRTSCDPQRQIPPHFVRPPLEKGV
jgi:hypothetical protein